MCMLPTSSVTPGQVFEEVGIDFAGPVFTKYGHAQKPVIVKSYISVFVSLSVKAVYLELVSELTTEGFIACLRRLVSRHGKPQVICSDNGTNFVGANRELSEIFNFLKQQVVQEKVSNFCSSERIKIMEVHPSMCSSHWRTVGSRCEKHQNPPSTNHWRDKIEEYMTLLTQVEACLNSRPLIPLEH